MSQDGSTLNDETHQDSADDLAADVHAAKQTAGANDLHRLAEELTQANDRALRAQAELENFRRRMRREMDDERRYAALPLIADLLSVVDNLDRALAAAENNEAANSLLQGVRMVQSQFLSILERHDCRRVGEVGEIFDPNMHQAIAQEPSDHVPFGNVTRVAQSGYRLHDRVVRPAQVLVSTGAPQAPGNSNSKTSG
jgi:molecular chaperone GrpE